MALRVLLADESSTIKRVIQLALQDFGVEVKAVPIGLDVLAVAHSFKPDIVLADVLLPKRSGYDVCGDIKKDPVLSQIPTVLMWSGFMGLDENKVQAAQIDRRLEKPFDPEQLREVVKALVPRLGTNAISDFLKFPQRPEFLEEAERVSAENPERSPDFQDLMEEDNDEFKDEFKHVPLPRTGASDQEEWSQEHLQKFALPSESQEDQLTSAPIDIPEDDLAQEGQFWTSMGEEPPPRPTTPESTSADTVAAHPLIPNLDYERAEQIIRQQAREVLESVAWKILPDIAERVVREELQKLLKDSERLEQI